MTQNYKEEDSLINLPFYSEEIESVTKKSKKKKVILKFLLKNIKNYLINSYQICYHSHKKEKKRSKRLTKRQILENVLPLYDNVVISKREHAHKFCAELKMLKL